MLIEFLHKVSHDAVKVSEKITNTALEFAREVSHGSLKVTEFGLKTLSSTFFFIESWQNGLKIAAQNVRYSAGVTKNAMNLSITNTEKAFDTAFDSLGIAKNFAHDMIYDNRAVSSILGSSHDNKYAMSKIRMSFREKGKDISTTEAYDKFKASHLKKAILYIPGLFCDETLWMDCIKKIDESEIVSLGISTRFFKKGYFPFYTRYNHGLHISENGKKLLELLDDLFSKDPDIVLNVITYSQGGLIFRSMLYYAKLQKREWANRFGKIIFISSPDGGSYLEKVGFWLGFLLEQSPDLFFKLLGIVGNLRSDGIKDLSHGILREEDWKENWHLFRYTIQHYFGELDDMDVYQFYCLLGDETNPLQMWFGDGIVEKDSLTYLTDKVFLKKPEPSTRSHKILNANHFTIVESEELMEKMDEIF
ncbi:MAG: hypothetical protein H7A23_05085 [Leptospiraceae bacterium]|nr:hypothetical protein [Leptospiraceae bacterium]MCP5493909.1 hypothetical protein [Leptospiraceae bacterium]